MLTKNLYYKLFVSIIIVIGLLNCKERKYDKVTTYKEVIDSIEYEQKEFYKAGKVIKTQTFDDGKILSESWLIKSEENKLLYYNLQYNLKGDTIVKKYFQTINGKTYNYGWGYYNYEDGRYEYKEYYPLKDSSVINQFRFYKNSVLIKDSSQYYTIKKINKVNNQLVLYTKNSDTALLLIPRESREGLSLVENFDTILPNFIKPFTWVYPNNKPLKGVIKIITPKSDMYFDKKSNSYMQNINIRTIYLNQPNSIDSINVNKAILW